MDIKLEDKYKLIEGTRFLTGAQALVRVPIVQARRDKKKDLNTAVFRSFFLSLLAWTIGTLTNAWAPVKNLVPSINLYLSSSLISTLYNFTMQIWLNYMVLNPY